MQASLDKENVVPSTPSPVKRAAARAPVVSGTPLRPLRNDVANGGRSVKARTDEYLRKVQMSRQEDAATKTPARAPGRAAAHASTKSVQLSALSDPFTMVVPKAAPQSHQQLLDQYTRKQHQIKQHEEHIRRLRFELDEIAANIEHAKREEKFSALQESNKQDIYRQAHLETTRELSGLGTEKAPASGPSGVELFHTLRSKASSMFEPPAAHEDFLLKSITKKASNMFAIHDDFSSMKKKASTMFAKREASDTLDELSHKTSRFFSDVMTTLSPRKTDRPDKMAVVDSSFNIDNLSLEDSHELVYEGDYLDIDEYESESEEEER